MSNPLFQTVAKAKTLMKEVLLIGGPADGETMPININNTYLRVIDDEDQEFVYKQFELLCEGTAFMVYADANLSLLEVYKELIRGYRKP